MVQYLQKVLDLYGRPVKPKSARAMDRWARREGVEVPEAVREWYEYRHLTRKLHFTNDGDFMLAPDSFQIEERDGVPFMFVMRENQGVFDWGVRIDGSPDPPVFVIMDQYCMLHAESFSTFMYAVVFDYQYVVGKLGTRWTFAQASPLSEVDQHFLDRTFVREPANTYGLHYAHAVRYSVGPLRRITIAHDTRDRDYMQALSETDSVSDAQRIVDELIPTYDQTHWFISASTKAELETLRSKLAPQWDRRHWY